LADKSAISTLPSAVIFIAARTAQPFTLQMTPDGTLEPVAYHGTAHLQALLDCDDFFIIPQGVKDIAAGQKIAT
jgi:hypothetical protein